MERTLSIIKPDATKRNLTGKINTKFEEVGLRIIAQKMIRLTREQAETFYCVHKSKFFFRSLVDSMVAGPIIVQVLEGDSAITKNRKVMGDTDPYQAIGGSIRKEFAKSIEANSVHGSDSIKNAQKEIAFFFAQYEIC